MSKHVHFSGPTKTTRPTTTIHLLGQSQPTTKRLSPACQQIVSETFTETTANLTIRSCLADSALYPIITGHKCNHVPLVPSSLHADMALTAAEYIWTILHFKTPVPGINVQDMEVLKPFIAQLPQEGEGQWIEMTVSGDLPAATTSAAAVGDTMTCTFRSVHADGSPDKMAHRASCTVRYEDKSTWTKEWSRYTHMVQNSISMLRDRATHGGAHIMQSGLAYKVFESFVTYDQQYRGMNEVIFDGLEGTATITFKAKPGDYTTSIHMDNSCHLSGFLCNALDAEDGPDSVYVSEGWEGMKCFDLDFLRKPQREGTKMAQGKDVLCGDVYTFLDGEVAIVWEGIKFKMVPRRVVNIFLPPPKR
ncbi:hypothetical protein LTR86_008090 [Recurvomyces mirabilis]|nr:hypothetical protein LTR86_008090 [Recurvomyces mirabilis]